MPKSYNTMSYVRTVKDNIFRMYCSTRNLWPVWFYYLNNEPRRLWNQEKKETDSLVGKIVADLARDGIAVTSVAELFPGINFADLQSFTTEAVAHPRIQEEITSHNRMIDDRIASGGVRKGSKKYLKDFIVEPYGSTGNDTIPDISNPFIRASLDERALRIAGGYMGLAPKLRGFSLRVTLPVPAGATEYFSQRWHRDPEDKKMLKIFIYMTDVLKPDEGPFIYIKGSQPGGRFGRVFPQAPPAAMYPIAGAVEKVIPSSVIQTCTAPAGTVIFADTSGLHKGGYTTSRPRLMYTGTYYSQASLAKHRLIVRDDITKLSRLARYALEQ